MDKGERQRLKQLANEAIIATYGYDSRESRLAEGLGKVLEEMDRLDTVPHCGSCQCRGVPE